MSSRTYLSIGDVLTLLRQEFPDVTISKIRFLESQGLVNPERTPSGYRKFYEHDVERLRWVLRQQREHFLPLKVIKGRLEHQGDALEEDEGAAETLAAPATARRGESAAVPALVGAGRSSQNEEAHRGPTLPGFEGQVAPGAPAVTAEESSAAAAATRARAGAASTAGDAGTATARTGSVAPAGRTGAQVSSAAPEQARAGRSPAAAAASPAASRAKASRSVEDPGAHAPVVALSGTSMTLEELAAASGLSVEAAAELESFGLLGSKVVGGVAYYDEDALTVARLAAGFAEFGVEARHLRLHKHSADREAGFIEQIVLPLLRQRNPESRQRAQETTAELSRLGQALRAVLLRGALRDVLGG
jgi:DNA-binding transcriptional MerR regulator